MSKKDVNSQEKERLAKSLQAALGEGGGEYSRSSAFVESLKHKLLGRWKLDEHSVDGKDYKKHIATSSLPGRVLEDVEYSCDYEFRESVCTKRTQISGWLRDTDEPTRYEYSMSLALSWKVSGGQLRTRPEIGYQLVKLNGQPRAVKDFGHSEEWGELSIAADGDSLKIVSGSDIKLLSKVGA